MSGVTGGQIAEVLIFGTIWALVFWVIPIRAIVIACRKRRMNPTPFIFMAFFMSWIMTAVVLSLIPHEPITEADREYEHRKFTNPHDRETFWLHQDGESNRTNTFIDLILEAQKRDRDSLPNMLM